MLICETPRLTIREYRLEDLKVLQQILSDPVTMHSWSVPFSQEAIDYWLLANLNRYQMNGFGRWAVILKESEQLIGSCGIAYKELQGRQEIDLACLIYAPFWRQGLGFEAAQACLSYGFQHLALPRFVAPIPKSHVAARRMAEKIGMQLEQTYADSRNRSSICLYAITHEKKIETLYS